MTIEPHPHALLSALLDDELAPVERSAVEGHLAGCADCRARLESLRATAALIRALPDPLPSRRLVPRLGAPPAWLAPLRTLSTIASGVSVFLFIASALLANVNTMARTTSGAAAAPAASAAAERGTAAPFGNAPTDQRLADAASKAVSPTPAAPAAQVPAPSAQTARSDSERVVLREPARPAPATPLSSPWPWLALALLTGALAIALQRRLRST